MTELRWIVGRALMWVGRTILPTRDRARLIVSDFSHDIDAQWHVKRKM